MAVGTGGGQPSSSSSTLHTLLRAAIAVQVLLLLEYFLDFTPHTHTTAGHQKRAAQRHYHGGVTVGETISDEQRPRDRRNSVDGQQGAGGDMSATLGSDDNGVIVGGGQGEGRRRGGAASERFVDKSVTSQRRQRTDDEKGGMGRPSPLSRAELCLGARMPWDPSTWRQGGTEGIDELLLPPSLAASSSSSSYLRRRRRLFTAAHQRPKSSNAAAAVSPAERPHGRGSEKPNRTNEKPSAWRSTRR